MWLKLTMKLHILSRVCSNFSYKNIKQSEYEPFLFIIRHLYIYTGILYYVYSVIEIGYRCDVARVITYIDSCCFTVLPTSYLTPQQSPESCNINPSETREQGCEPDTEHLKYIIPYLSRCNLLCIRHDSIVATSSGEFCEKSLWQVSPRTAAPHSLYFTTDGLRLYDMSRTQGFLIQYHWLVHY